LAGAKDQLEVRFKENSPIEEEEITGGEMILSGEAMPYWEGNAHAGSGERSKESSLRIKKKFQKVF